MPYPNDQCRRRPTPSPDRCSLNKPLLSILVLSSLVSIPQTTQACKTLSPTASLDTQYPPCALPCLFCEDDDYIYNFANNCDYPSGGCCGTGSSGNNATESGNKDEEKERQTLVIQETWACVRSLCAASAESEGGGVVGGDGEKGGGEKGDVAQQAFDVFVRFCEDRNAALVEEDVPGGYSLDGSNDEERGNGKCPLLRDTMMLIVVDCANSDGDTDSGSGGLATRYKIAIGVSIGGAFLVAAIAWLVWRRFFRREDDSEVGDGEGVVQVGGGDEEESGGSFGEMLEQTRPASHSSSHPFQRSRPASRSSSHSFRETEDDIP